MNQRSNIGAQSKIPALAITNMDLDELNEVRIANLGPNEFDHRDFSRITVPTDGEILWKLPTLKGAERVASFIQTKIGWIVPTHLRFTTSNVRGGPAPALCPFSEQASLRPTASRTGNRSC
jgi:hypothetical protein